MSAIETFLYELAVATLPRVCLKEKPGIVGIVIDEDTITGMKKVHWGVQDRAVVETWHDGDTLEGAFSGIKTIRDVPTGDGRIKAETNGHSR